MTKKFELDRRIVDVLESFGWRILDSYIDYDGDVNVVLEFYSDLGEDFKVALLFDGTVHGFVVQFRDYVMYFDPDMHAVEWSRRFIMGGKEPSIRALLADADSIDEHLKETSDALAQIDDDD